MGVDFIFRLQKRNYSKLWKQILSGELDFDFILENEKLKNKMKGQKVRVIVLIPILNNNETNEKECFLPITRGLSEFIVYSICLPNNEVWYDISQRRNRVFDRDFGRYQ